MSGIHIQYTKQYTAMLEIYPRCTVACMHACLILTSATDMEKSELLMQDPDEEKEQGLNMASIRSTG